MGRDRTDYSTPDPSDVARRAEEFVTHFVDRASGAGGPQVDEALQSLGRAGKPDVDAATRLLDEALVRWGQSIDAASSTLRGSVTAVGRNAGSLEDAVRLTSEAADLFLRATADAAVLQGEISDRAARIEAYMSLCVAVEADAARAATALERRGDAPGAALVRGGPLLVAGQRREELAEVTVVLSQGIAGLDLGRRTAAELHTRLVNAQSLMAATLAGESAAQALAGARAALEGALAHADAVPR